MSTRWLSTRISLLLRCLATFCVVFCVMRPVIAAPTVRTVVALESLADGEHACQKLLTRELIRQAFLLTAREEFRMATRDGVLREIGEEKIADVRSFRLQVDLLQFTHVKIRLEAVWGGVESWTAEFKDGGEKQLESALTLADGWSRNEFVQWLKGAGLSALPLPEPNPEIDLKRPVPLDLVSQTEVLRKLHAALLHDPRSPLLNSRIAQHYALLGSLTEPHWGISNKVFKARALLYAQRAVHFDPTDAGAAWIKSFVFALCGRHDLAERELTRAKSLSNPKSTPAWSKALYQFVTWDQPGLAKSAESDEPLVAYLNMLAQEIVGSSYHRVEACHRVIEVAPECLRAMWTLANIKNLFSLRRMMSMTQLEQFLVSFPQQVAKIPGLSDKVRDAASEIDYRRSPEASIDKTVTLIHFLNQAAVTEDRQEPSLAALATVATDLHFVHVVRHLLTEVFGTVQEMTQERALYRRLLRPHPTGEFINVIQRNSFESQRIYIEVAPLLLKLPVTEASMPTILLLAWLRATNVQGALEQRVRGERDDVVPDLLAKLDDQLSDGELHGAMGVLQRLSPGCPGLIVAKIKHDWKNARSAAPGWEEKSSSPLIFEALGDRYEETAEDNSEDRAAARRCWKKLNEVEPSQASYRRLAGHYKRYDMEEEWKQALLELIKLPIVDMDGYQANEQLANWYMDRHDWQTAKPFALEAAESGSAWGAICAARCLEGLQEWEQAEEFVKYESERYESQWIDWYLWCQRTGRGDLGSARKLCQSAIERMSDQQRSTSQSLGIYLHLEGDLGKAANMYQSFFEAGDASGYWAIQTVLLLDQLGRTKERDAWIDSLNEKGQPFAVLFSHQMVRSLDASAPPVSEADLEFCYGYGAAFDSPTNAAYFIGKLLLQRNKKEAAIAWLQRAATSPVTIKWSCTLAATELRRLGVPVAPTRIHDFDEPLVEALILTRKGLTYRNSDKLELAAKSMDAALASAPDWPVAQFCKANVIKRLGQQKAAEALFTQVLERVPRQPFVLVLRGQIREELNDRSGAINDYGAASKIIPLDALTKSRLMVLRAEAIPPK